MAKATGTQVEYRDHTRMTSAVSVQRATHYDSSPSEATQVSRSAVLPTFLGIGSVRCGTTWLHHLLRDHPQIHMSTPKQLDFFDKNVLRHDLEWYCSHFEPPAGGTLRLVRGEISPRSAGLSPSVVARVARFLPEVTLVLMIRNPVDRLWSHLVQEVGFRGKRDPGSLSCSYVQQFCESPRCTRFSDYVSIIDTWTREYGRDRLLVELFDDLRRQPSELLHRVLHHIGADSSWRPSKVQLTSPVHSSRQLVGKEHGMPAGIRAWLSRRWLEPTKRLDHILGGRVGHWIEQLERDARHITTSSGLVHGLRRTTIGTLNRTAWHAVLWRRQRLATSRWDTLLQFQAQFAPRHMSA